MGSKMQDNSSDSDMDMVEESEDELNITSYFHDDIEESTDDDGIKEHSHEHDTAKSSGEFGIKDLLEDDFTEIPMDVVSSPTQTRKSHMITCPVCFEITILTKNSGIYDNLIAACMEKRTLTNKRSCDKDEEH